MTVTAYTLHLGFNWYGSTLGYVWDRSTGFYFLQNALEDSSGVAAPFTNFKTGEKVSIVIWDLSSSSDWTKDYLPEFVLDLAFSELDNPTTIDPTTLFKGVTPKTEKVNETTQHYLQFKSGYNRGQTTCLPWGPAQGSSTTLKPLIFDVASSIQCKLSFRLSVTTDSQKIFISDPEIIVSSTSS